MLDTAKREGRYEAEAWRVRKDGSRLFASVVVDPIRDEEGEVGIAHDFNNLMMIVLGNLDTLKRHTSGLAPNIERNLNNAIRGAQRAASLTSRLLAFSRATARSQAAGRQQIPVRVCGVPTALAR